MLECIRHAHHFVHFFVNYDEFIENSEKILTAVADRFRLSVNTAEFEMIARDFLDKGLRHTKFDARHLYDDASCPREIALAYERLGRMRREPVNSRPETGNLVRISGMLRSCLRSAGLLTGGAAR